VEQIARAEEHAGDDHQPEGRDDQLGGKPAPWEPAGPRLGQGWAHDEYQRRGQEPDVEYPGWQLLPCLTPGHVEVIHQDAAAVERVSPGFIRSAEKIPRGVGDNDEPDQGAQADRQPRPTLGG
jgi:hypothetical protein